MGGRMLIFSLLQLLSPIRDSSSQVSPGTFSDCTGSAHFQSAGYVRSRPGNIRGTKKDHSLRGPGVLDNCTSSPVLPLLFLLQGPQTAAPYLLSGSYTCFPSGRQGVLSLCYQNRNLILLE